MENVKIIAPETLEKVIAHLDELFTLECKVYGIRGPVQPENIRSLLEPMMKKTVKHYEDNSYEATTDYSNIVNDLFDEFVNRSCPDTGYFFRDITWKMYKRAQAYENIEQAYENIENAIGEIYKNIPYDDKTAKAIYTDLEEKMREAYAEDTTAVWQEVLNNISERITTIRKNDPELD